MAVPAREVPAPTPARPRPGRGARPFAPRPGGRTGARRPGRSVPFLLLFLAVTAVMVTGLVAAQALVAQGAFRVQELTQRVEHLRSGYGRLLLRHAELTNPERIEDWAHRAGLVRREGLQVLPVPAGRSHRAEGGGAVARGAGG